VEVTEVNKKWLWISGALFTSIPLFVFFWWLCWGRFETSTDDSYVNGNQVRLTSQIDGFVASIYADDTDLVEEGQILIELDKTDREIALEKAKAVLGEKIREVTKLFEAVYVSASEYDKANAFFVDAEVRYVNRKEVVESGAISEEEYIHAEAAYYAAKAQVASSKYSLMKAISEVQNTTVRTHPLVEKAKSDLREAYLNLQRCTIKSPATGIVALRKVQVGQSITKQLPLLAVIPLNQMWVDANFKEVDLSKIRIGQAASITSDMYGRSVVYKGQVIGIGIGSGAVFSPLPPQNATGNWIKIVQRIPVRISIDPEQLKRIPLRLGLSMNVSVDLHDTEGLMVPIKIPEASMYNTDVFNNQMDGVENLIDSIFDQNETLEID
jgi:membrane fusion protein (multidrug efflux system)